MMLLLRQPVKCDTSTVMLLLLLLLVVVLVLVMMMLMGNGMVRGVWVWRRLLRVLVLELGE